MIKTLGRQWHNWKKLKSEMYGFDFKIHYNKDGLPDAIVFMSHVMCLNLILFGDILFFNPGFIVREVNY